MPFIECLLYTRSYARGFTEVCQTPENSHVRWIILISTLKIRRKDAQEVKKPAKMGLHFPLVLP